MTSTSKRILRQQLVLFLMWTALGLFMFSQGLFQKVVTRDPTPWWHHLASWMVGVYLWFLLTPVVLWLGRRYPIARSNWIRRTALHLPLSIVTGFLLIATESFILRSLGLFPMLMTSYAVTFIFLFMIGFHQTVMTYWTVLAVQYGLGWYRAYQERKQAALRLELHSSQLQRQLTEAHLSTLKMQLQPHFLFNTLNAIMVLVRQQKGREAEEMLARLSDLLRLVLEDVNAQEVPLSRELEYLQLYLSIEQVRFQDRMRVEIDADPEILEASVPHMVLQPLVENAIRHGIGRSLSAGQIRITACHVDSRLEIKVQDDGPGIAASTPGHKSGIGLANTRARLRQLYGDSAELRVENGEQRGVTATVFLPCRIAPTRKQPLTEDHALHGAAR